MNRIIYALFIILFIGAAAFPQSQMSTGDIKGTVRDPSGAVVPGATITVTNVETGVSRTATTETTGEYRMLVLPPGTYSVKIQALGFAPHTTPAVRVFVSPSVVIDAPVWAAEI